jgi:hypothetical protein
MMRWGRMMLGVGLVAAVAVSNLAAAQSVFLVYTGNFSSERAVGETVERVALEMNRFSGAIEVDWQWHQVRDFRPATAIRTVKKRYSDRKRFAADCDLMKKRLF